MLPAAEESAIQSDSYIDALLAAHARQPLPLPPGGLLPEPGVRQVIRLLEKSLPRFHPSFMFEERLAQQLREIALGGLTDQPLPVALDRRLLLGGALASGVSLAGAAAMLAWRRTRRRPWLT